MRCPTCKNSFHPQPDGLGTYWTDEDDENSREAVEFSIQRCPSCAELIVVRQAGTGSNTTPAGLVLEDVEAESVIYPVKDEFVVATEVPDDYRAEYLEAHDALKYSAKASAALSRRLLQKTLREKLNIKKRDLSLEIDAFIDSGTAPSYLTGAIDAVRHIGNFAAHPIKFTNSGEIVDVEPGEAEWLIEVLDSLFDFVFVQPARLKQRRASLNQKLKELGKPELKGA